MRVPLSIDMVMLTVKVVRFRQWYALGNKKTVTNLGVAQLAERLFWEQEAVGSSPATQTTNGC